MMSEEDRHTIEEVAVLYQLEPQLRDIYVEGSSDLNFLKWFLEGKGEYQAAVYEISTIEIPAKKTQSYGLENNNRGRVIAFAFELESILRPQSSQVTCVADKDFDMIFNKHYNCSLILFTDYTCMEMYLFHEKCMNKYLRVCLQGFPLQAEKALEHMSNILQTIFLIRLANELLDLKLEWLTFERCCSLKGEEIVFNADEYVTRYLNTNRRLDKKKDFLNVIETWRLKLTDDPRHQMNGHDFIALLAWSILKHGVDRRLCDKNVVKRTLFGCVDIEQLENERFFKRLLERVRGKV